MKSIYVRIIGVVVGVIMIALLEYLSSFIYPFPEGLDVNNKEAFADFVKNKPLGAFLCILVVYNLASFVAGMVVTYLNQAEGRKNAIFVGLVLTAFGVMNMITIPHPVWFMIASTLIYVPSAMLGNLVMNSLKK